MPDRPADALLGLSARPGLGLEALTAEVRSHLEGASLTVFEPGPEDGVGAPGYVRYLACQETRDDGPATHHVVFVAAEPWTPESTELFMEAFYLLPASTPPETGAPWFHVVAPEPLPAGVAYLFGNTWSGALESRLFAVLAEPIPDPNDPEPYVERTREMFAQVGVDTSPGETALAELDRLLAALPRPSEGDTSYRPVATLLAIGLAFSAELRHRHRSLDWVTGDAALARFYALGVRTHEETYLRPIDYVFDAYDSTATAPLAAYEELVRVRLRHLGDQP